MENKYKPKYHILISRVNDTPLNFCATGEEVEYIKEIYHSLLNKLSCSISELDN